MKQKLLNSFKLRVFMLVAILCAGFSGSAWGETETITFPSSSANADMSSSGVSVTGTDVSVTISKGTGSNLATNTDGTRIYNGNSMVFTSANNKKISKIVFAYKRNKKQTNGLTANNGSFTTAFTVGNSQASNLSATWEASNETTTSVTFTVGSGSGNYALQSAEVTYVETGGSSLTASDLALTGAPVALSFDLYPSATAQTVSFTTSSTGAVTVSESEYVTTSVSGNTITVTPVKVTPSAQTITISQEADATYAAGSKTFTVTVDDSTPFTGVIFDATKDTGTSPIVKDNVSFACNNGVLNNGSEYRMYKNSITTISTTDGSKITKIEFIGVSGNPASGFGSQTGWTTSNYDGTWTGSAESVSFTASEAQVRATKIKVTVEASTTVATPVITGTTSFLNSTEVTITCATDGATIKYSTDNGSTWTDYSAPFTIDNTTTVKAKATKSPLTDSEIAEETFTKITPIDVATALATEDDTEVYVQGIISRVTYFGSGSITYFISDDGTTTDELEVYNGKGLDGAAFTAQTDLQAGDLVVVKGTLTTYNSVKELKAGSQLVSLVRPQRPTITVSPATANPAASEVEGTLAIAYANLTISSMSDFDIQFCDAEGADDSQPNWVDEVCVAEEEGNTGNYVVSYVIEENDGAARSAYFKVYAMDDETNLVYSNLVTITQAAPVVTNTYTLASSITSGKHYVIASGNDGGVKVMGTQNSNNRAAVDGTVANNTLSVISNAGAVEFVIYGPDADGYYTIYDGSGYLYAASSSSNHLKTQETNNENSQWKIEFVITGENNVGSASIVAEGSSNHNVMQYNNGSDLFSCYASASQSPIYLYEKSGEATPTESKTLNGSGYATYCSQNALDFTGNTDVTAWIITDANSTTGVITFSQIEGKAPAGTGMLLMGEAGNNITINSATGKVTAITTNLLEGTTAQKTVSDGEYYGLSGNQFVPVNAGNVPAGKALLPASEVSSNVKSFTFVFEGADGIKTVEHVSAEEAAEIFNLAGQRLQKAQRGVNIINGKKVLVK